MSAIIVSAKDLEPGPSRSAAFEKATEHQKWLMAQEAHITEKFKPYLKLDNLK